MVSVDVKHHVYLLTYSVNRIALIGPDRQIDDLALHQLVAPTRAYILKTCKH